ncbi:phosphoglucosamine mutase [Acholeplasma equirhinis]|uniref:phosphoglucosamine mutase n=1 Tax=Acholeplasma equirhinis TaxID=555393 RepID=UPI00197A8BA2|nr:phosphoglucosamine mutase [Acholeplasma equirhinis]MBN3489980.1 phosphoglucosamine mutase [Acholeplasma equirhinis]
MKYFGTDGIRGKAFEKLNSNLAFKLGQAIAKRFKPESIVIGQDTRLSSNMLAHGVAYGAALGGVNVFMADVVSTPMIAYYSKMKDMIGVMITASHNPYTDNGIKVIKSGYKMLDQEEIDLESYIDDGKVYIAEKFGSINITKEVESLYLQVYEDLMIPNTKLSISFDTANGATYKIGKKIIEKYVETSYQIGDNPDGLNINLNVGSTHLDAIKSAVALYKSDLGLSFDGDGDRILVIDKDGTLFDGDLIVYVIAKYLKSVGMLKKDTVVLTQMSNPGVLAAFKRLGIKVIQTAVGDKYVSEVLIKEDLTIGGENSGHIIINDILPSGDGVFAGMFLIKTLTENDMNLKDYTKEVVIYPQKLVNIPNVNKAVLELEEVKKVIMEVRSELPEDSLLLVRPSGTEPLVRVTISCQDSVMLEKNMAKIVDKIKELGEMK